MVHTEKSVVVSAQMKQKYYAGLLAVQGGAFDIEPTKGEIQANYGKVLQSGLGVVSLYASTDKWNTPAAQQLLASINFKNSNLIATNAYKASSNLFALRDSLISAYVTIIIMGVSLAFELGGFSDIEGVAANIIAISQNPITQFPALQTYFDNINKFVDAVSARDVAEANKQAADLKAGASALFTALIPQLITYYVLAAKASGKQGNYKADVGLFLGSLVTVYKPVTDGNIDAIAKLAATPLPSK